MRRREFIAMLGGAAVALPLGITQVLAKRPLIGCLAGVSQKEAQRFLTGFPEGMRELGYVEGRDYEIEYRYANGDVTWIQALANELVRLNPEILATGNPQAAVALRRATAAIPIVSASLIDPVGLGLVESYAHPGGNVTGILSTLDTLPGKQLELAHEMVPAAARIGMLVNVHSRTFGVVRRSAEAAAETLGVVLVANEVRSADDIDAAFQALVRERVQIIIVYPDPLFGTERRRIAALASAAQLPTMYALREHVEDGGLVSYGVNLRENWRHVASFVDKILKGSKPGDLPVEFPTKLELVINLKTAKALGLAIPPSFLLRADEVIE